MPTGSKVTRAPRAKKTANANDALFASVMAAPTSAEIARLLGKNGKQLRSFVRGTLGVFVSRGGVLTDDARKAIFEKYGPKN